MTLANFVLILMTFIAGAIYELGCVFWVHNSEQGKPIRTALWSMIVASCEILGIGQSITNPIAAPFFILGYGFGSYLGVVVAKRKLLR